MDTNQLHAELVEAYKSDVKSRAQWLSTVGMASLYLLNDVLAAVYSHDDEVIDFNKALESTGYFVPHNTRELTIENARTGEQVTYNWSDINLLIDGRTSSAMTESEFVCPRIYDSHVPLQYKELDEMVDLAHERGELLPFWMDQPYSASKSKKPKPDTTTSWDRFDQLRTSIQDAVLPMAMAALDGIEESLSNLIADSDEPDEQVPDYHEKIEQLSSELSKEREASSDLAYKLSAMIGECAHLRAEMSAVLAELAIVLKQKTVKTAIDACDKESVVTARARLRDYYKMYATLAND